MDVSWHERNHITHQLSADFLRIMKSHLKPNGIIYFNTTDSEDVIYTAAQVYRHFVRYDDFLAASDAPFDVSQPEAWANMQKFVKQPVAAMYRPGIHMRVLRHLASEPLFDLGDSYRCRSDLVMITDDNMATEFRRAKLSGGVTWSEFLARVWHSG